MKIFLTGFQRSGTTLLRHVIRNHPDIRRVFHEDCLLAKGVDFIRNSVKFDIDKLHWGEKLPWYGLKPRKVYNGTIIDYCEEWTSLFPDSKIIQIIRHPADVMISNKRTFKIEYDKCYEIMNSCFEKVIPIIDSFDNWLTIKFEDLVITPLDTLTKIYEFLNIDSSIETVMSIMTHKQYRLDGISKSRAFAHVKENIEMKYDFTNINNILNEVYGVKY